VTTLLESKARPYGSSKGAALSVVVHGALIAAAVVASGAVGLPEREKIEEHPILYVTPPPPKVYVAPERLPEPKRAPPSKAPRTAPPPPKAPPPPREVAAPSPQPQRVTVPVIAPIKVPTSLPAIDLKAMPTVSDAELARASDAVKATGRGAKSSSDGDVDSRSGGKGLGSGDAGRAYNENQVDRAVQMTRAATPRYPDALRSVSVTGEVQVRYIVDTRGRVEPGSIQVLSATHKLFADAVRAALLESRFRPAEAGGRAVRQLVEQPFIFKLDR
jgi:periplasmic protein TonB